ncbi:hypothetical protein MRX96_052021, partial [Rhipicephalus microplus]
HVILFFKAFGATVLHLVVSNLVCRDLVYHNSLHFNERLLRYLLFHVLLHLMLLFRRLFHHLVAKPPMSVRNVLTYAAA